MKIVLIEDEPKAAVNLTNMILEAEASAQVLEILDSIDTSLDYFAEKGFPDLIFSDIQIADGLSFEIFAQYPPQCPVIFCTAFDQYALQAFKANGIEYLLKPFGLEDVKQALQKYKSLKTSSEMPLNFQKMLAQLANPYKENFLLSFRERIIPVNVASLPYFYSSKHQTFVNFEQKEISLPHSLDELEKMLNPRDFYRANRQFIINRKFVKEIQHHFARKLVVLMQQATPESILISKLKTSDFLAWMES